jgi:hypothetical protein
MSDFDKLKDEATKEVKEHPQQVKEGEQFAEKKLGLGSQDDQKEDAGQSQGGGDSQPQGG